jgi:hypothetical protein
MQMVRHGQQQFAAPKPASLHGQNRVNDFEKYVFVRQLVLSFGETTNGYKIGFFCRINPQRNVMREFFSFHQEFTREAGQIFQKSEKR